LLDDERFRSGVGETEVVADVSVRFFHLPEVVTAFGESDFLGTEVSEEEEEEEGEEEVFHKMDYFIN